MSSTVLSAAVVAAMAIGASMGFGAQRTAGLLGALLLGLTGWRKGSLSASGALADDCNSSIVIVCHTGIPRCMTSSSGALAAACVGALTIGYTFRGGCVLLAFYLSSSRLTRFKEELKAVDVEHKAGGQRDWKQVCCTRTEQAATRALHWQHACVPSCVVL